MRRSSLTVLSGFFVPAMSLFIAMPVHAHGQPSAGQSADHETFVDVMVHLQESVDTPDEVTPPCGKGTADQRFVVLDGDEEVCDNTTGLYWQQTPDSVGRTWQEAVDHCRTVRSGSRLPELMELISLVDDSQVSPALPGSHPFDNVQSASAARYWSATEASFSIGSPWLVDLASGIVHNGRVSNDFFVWCVRDGRSSQERRNAQHIDENLGIPAPFPDSP